MNFRLYSADNYRPEKLSISAPPTVPATLENNHNSHHPGISDQNTPPILDTSKLFHPREHSFTHCVELHIHLASLCFSITEGSSQLPPKKGLNSQNQSIKAGDQQQVSPPPSSPLETDACCPCTGSSSSQHGLSVHVELGDM